MFKRIKGVVKNVKSTNILDTVKRTVERYKDQPLSASWEELEGSLIKNPAVLLVDCSNLYNQVKRSLGTYISDNEVIVELQNLFKDIMRTHDDLSIQYVRFILRIGGEQDRKKKEAFWKLVKKSLNEYMFSELVTVWGYLSVDDVHLLGEFVSWMSKHAVDEEMVDLNEKETDKVIEKKKKILGRFQKRNAYKVVVITGDVGLITRMKNLKKCLNTEREAIYISVDRKEKGHWKFKRL